MFDSLLSCIYDSRPELQGASSTAELMQILAGPYDGPVVKELLNPFSWASDVCIMQKLLHLGFDVNMPMPGGENVYFQLSLRHSDPGGMEKRLRWLAKHCPNTAHVSDNGITAITSLLQRELCYWRQQQFNTQTRQAFARVWTIWSSLCSSSLCPRIPRRGRAMTIMC